MYHVYTLSDPRDDTIRYVGMTCNPHTRLLKHIATPAARTKRKWIHDLQDSGLKPVMTIIETLDDLEQAKRQEQDWIHYYCEQGTPLTNAFIRTPTDRQSGKGTLHFARRKIGLNQDELAALSGIPQVVISRYEHGVPVLRDDAIKLIEAINAKYAQIFNAQKRIGTLSRKRETLGSPTLQINDLDWNVEGL